MGRVRWGAYCPNHWWSEHCLIVPLNPGSLSHSECSSPSLITPPQSPLNLETSSFASSQSQGSISTLPRISVSPVPIGERRKDRYDWKSWLQISKAIYKNISHPCPAGWHVCTVMMLLTAANEFVHICLTKFTGLFFLKNVQIGSWVLIWVFVPNGILRNGFSNDRWKMSEWYATLIEIHVDIQWISYDILFGSFLWFLRNGSSDVKHCVGILFSPFLQQFCFMVHFESPTPLYLVHFCSMCVISVLHSPLYLPPASPRPSISRSLYRNRSFLRIPLAARPRFSSLRSLRFVLHHSAEVKGMCPLPPGSRHSHASMQFHRGAE